jgi:hypothetical protein
LPAWIDASKGGERRVRRELAEAEAGGATLAEALALGAEVDGVVRLQQPSFETRTTVAITAAIALET